MRLSRSDFVAPVLAIIAGAAIGGLLTLSPLVLRAPSDVPASDPVVSATSINSATAFQPSGPVPDDYVLGPGDQVSLILTGNVELTHELTVTREGVVVVPQLGRISAAGLTVAQFRIFLRETLLANSYSGITRGTVFVDVTLTRLRTIQVFLTGEVDQPGAYQLASVATVANALYAAGGPTELGDLREIEVRRSSGDGATLELYPYGPETLRLEQGDVIFVPPLVSAPADAVAQTDLTGNWLLKVGTQTPGSPIQLQLVITIAQDGQALTVSGVAGNAGAFEMTGSIEESAVQLLWQVDREWGTVEYRFTGTTTETGMSGSVEVDSGQAVTETDWTAVPSLVF